MRNRVLAGTMRRAVAAGSALVLIGGVVAGVSPVGAGVARAVDGGAMPFDFDGDGFADLAVGVPWEDLRGKGDVGAVQVLYGSASGVSARDQVWHQGRRGVKGALERWDRFGEALESGDFDGDGYADLAIGIPFEDVGSVRDAGAVQVLFGGPGGLTARDQVWHQGKRGVPGSNEREDSFGSSLAAGDFDGDGYADLAVGVGGEDIGSIESAGAVTVLRGSPGGLTASAAQTWRQARGGLPSQPAEWERFGAELAVGDVNGDGRDDLAIGVWQEADSPKDYDQPGSGMHLLLGSPTGLTSVGGQYFLAADLGLWPGSRFKLTFADFDRDGRADLSLAGGSTAVLYGHADGLHPGPLPDASAPGVDAVWHVGGGDEDYGAVVAAGDLTGDGYPDLAVGARVILGTAAGLGPAYVDWVAWRSADGRAVPVDRIGSGDVAVLPFSGGSHAWLVVSHYVDPPELPDGAGAVTVVRGTLTGEPGPWAMWSQDSPGINGAAEAGDNFGFVIGPSQHRGA